MGENIEDLRDFYEQQKVQSEIASDAGVNDEKKTVSGEFDIENSYTASGFTKDITDLKERVVKLELLNYAMWLMLESKGFTHDEFNAAIGQAQEIVANRATAKTEAIICPKCKRALQATGVFGARCIYCGHEQLSNPYQQDIPFGTNSEEPVTEEYDVVKDLDFEES